MTGVDEPDNDAPLGVGDSLIGTVLDGRYRVDALLGRGGMSAVYRAHNLSMDRPVAVKVLLHSLNDPTALQRFRLEARTLCQVKHKHLIEVYNMGLIEDRSPYMVIEYLEGESLATRISRAGALDARWSSALLIDICAGLAEAHKQGILHRDIKPGNIMIATTSDAGECAKLLDFGIAKVQQLDGGGKLTQTGSVLGSPAYMSPEQCQGKQLDARSEVYALGCVLFEMLAGHEPFQSDNLLEVLSKHETADAVLPVAAQVPESLANIVYRCLEKDPDHRYKQVEELSNDLQNFLDGKAVTAGVRRRRRQPLAPKKPMRAQLAILTAALATGVLVVPPARAVLLKQLASWCPDARATAFLNDKLIDALQQSGDAASLSEAARLEMVRAENSENAERKANHLQSAAMFFNGASDRARALDAAKRRVLCFSSSSSSLDECVAYWTASLDYLYLKSEEDRGKEVRKEVLENLEGLEKAVETADDDDRQLKLKLVAVYGNNLQRFFGAEGDRFRSARDYWAGMVWNAHVPALLGDQERAADNLRVLIHSNDAFRKDSALALRAYGQYLLLLSKLQRNDEVIAVAGEWLKAFPQDKATAAGAKLYIAEALYARGDFARAVDELSPLCDEFLRARRAKIDVSQDIQMTCIYYLCRAYNALGKRELVLETSALAEQAGITSGRTELEKAAALIAKKQYSAAEPVLKAVLVDSQQHERLNVPSYWWGELARCQLRRGDLDAAAASLKEALDVRLRKVKRRGQERDFERRLQLATQLSDIYRRKKQFDDDLALWNRESALDAEAAGVVSPGVLASVRDRLATAKAAVEAAKTRY